MHNANSKVYTFLQVGGLFGSVANKAWLKIIEEQ